ncbi:MAG TPA: GNAT family N-acetyltransferase [Bryobacteraceae bacterium]|nr:GNAT family N-acetyltransferase [Bryobacteraceae bacterium]
MSIRARMLTLADVPDACALSQSAGWNQTADDWRLAIEMNPDGCFAIEADSNVVATTTTIPYGTRLAWIGMVLTHPEYRGRGFARALMQRALDHLGSVETVKLDATEMGAPLYRQFGFVDECPIERWIRSPLPSPPAKADVYLPDPELDGEAFGADRCALLARLSRIESASAPGAIAMGRGTRFGPCVSRSKESAVALLHWYLARHCGGEILWDTFPSELPKSEGFKIYRRLTRMTRGRVLHPNNAVVYAGAGLEFG